MEIINKGGILALIGPAIAGYGVCFTGISMDSEFTSTISYSENSMSYRKKNCSFWHPLRGSKLSGNSNSHRKCSISIRLLSVQRSRHERILSLLES